MRRIEFLLPGPLGTIGGGHVYDRAVIAGLRAAGHPVTVLELAGRHPLADDVARASALVAWARLAPDALPVIDGMTLPAFAPLADALAGRGTVGLIHHPTALEPEFAADGRATLRHVERRMFAACARLIVTSAATADRLVAEFDVPRAKIAVVVPGTPAAPRSPGSGGPGCEILAIGVVTPRKGHDVLIRALAKLPDLDWHLTIVGGVRDAAHAASLPALARDLGVAARVTFAGELVDAALEAAWQRADIFALATRFEGYGMAIAEALRRGVPVAITDGGAAAALVSPQTGAVAPVGDEAALSRALRRMIYDAGLRAEMRAAAFAAGQALPDWPAQASAFAAAAGLAPP